MFEGYQIRDISTPDRGYGSARIRLRHGGEGRPLLLIHGNPLTHVSWHRVAPLLEHHFHLVCVDLRGYGDSVGPCEGAADSINYSFRAMAQDLVDVMAELGHERFLVAGHDRGARTAHRMALDHPDRVERAALIDILPSHHIWTHATAAWANSSWHWTFMIQPYDLPERMMASVPAAYFIEKKIGKPGKGLTPFSPEALSEYVRCFNWKTIRGSCEDYRACATSDLRMDTADFVADRRIGCPLLIIWGKESHTGKVYGDVLSIWRRYAGDHIDGGPIDAGHYVNEEKPRETADWLLRHFSGQAGPSPT